MRFFKTNLNLYCENLQKHKSTLKYQAVLKRSAALVQTELCQKC